MIQTLISLMMVSMLILRLSRGEASASRIGELLESEPEVKNPQNGATDFRPEGRSAFENVRFSFSGSEHDRC